METRRLRLEDEVHLCDRLQSNERVNTRYYVSDSDLPFDHWASQWRQDDGPRTISDVFENCVLPLCLDSQVARMRRVLGRSQAGGPPETPILNHPSRPMMNAPTNNHRMRAFTPPHRT